MLGFSKGCKEKYINIKVKQKERYVNQPKKQLEESMEKKQRIAQIYGYVVCLVTVITFLISVTHLVNAIIDLIDPLYARHSDLNLASFENFKMDALKSTQKEPAYVPDDQTLRAMYEAAKADIIKSVQHRTRRSIIVNSLLIALCFALFGTHWRWMRKLARAEE